MISFTEDQLDGIQELFNIGTGTAASALNDLVGAHVAFQVQGVRVCTASDLNESLGFKKEVVLSSVWLDFEGPFSGAACLLFPTSYAATLVHVLTGEEPGTLELNTIKSGTLMEVGNIVINGVLGVLANMIGTEFGFSVPYYLEDRIDKLFGRAVVKPSITFVARMDFSIEKLAIGGHVLLIFELSSSDSFLDNLDKMICP